MALVIYSCLIEGLQYRGELFKQELVVICKGVIFYAFTAFWYIVIVEALDIMFTVNSAYNRAKI